MNWPMKRMLLLCLLCALALKPLLADSLPDVQGDSRPSASEWNEFYHSPPGTLKANEGYHVSLDYTVAAREPNAKFYVLARRVGTDGSLGWKEWAGDAGATGHIDTQLATGGGDTTLILGIQNKGAITVTHLTITADPALRPPDWPVPVRTWHSPGQTQYYADSVHGRDANDGKSAKHPWRTLDRINAGVFAPGDTLLLRAGSRWTGFLAPGGSGAAGELITIKAYGAGPKPSLDAAGRYLATVSLHNGEYWDVAGLDIANRASAPVPNLCGVKVREDDFGVAHRIVLHDLDIHDVRGSNVKSEGGSGIDCSSSGGKIKTRYDGLTIAHCRLARTDRNGITMGAYYPRPAWPLSTHVVIRGNALMDIGGDGIVPIGCDGCMIEHNTLHGGRMRADDYAAGIWPWSCDNTVVQFNEVSGMKGTKDGEGYDSDYNCRNTLFQYNFSHDNDGGFMLICDDGGQKPPWNIGNGGTVIRYNISVNDGEHTFNITGPCLNTRIYNNVFSLGAGKNVPFVASGNWGNAWAADTRFVNNIFYVAPGGESRFDFGGMTGVVFDHNAFQGDIAVRPTDAAAFLADPKLTAPGSTRATGYALAPGSPLRRAGRSVPASGGRDFWGSPLSTEQPPDVGAGHLP